MAGVEERHELDVLARVLQLRHGQHPAEALLRPPSQDEADGPIRLGRICHAQTRLGSFGLTENLLAEHTGVFGRSGSGKSNLAMAMIRQIKTPWAVIDFKRSSRNLALLDQEVTVLSLGRNVGAPLRFNPLDPPPGIPLESHLRVLVEQIAVHWFAGDGVIALLERVLREVYQQHQQPTLLQVREFASNMKLSGREKLWHQTLMRILDQLTSGPMRQTCCSVPDNRLLHQLLSSKTIIELDGMNTRDAAFLASYLVSWINHALLDKPGATGSGLKFFLMVDEAHHLLAKQEGGESTLELALKEAREAGLGLLIASQSPSQMSTTVMANVHTAVSMNCRSRQDINAAASTLLLTEEQKPLLSTLPVGQAIARKASGWPYPCQVAVPFIDIPGKFTDTMVYQRYLSSPFCLAQSDPTVSVGNRANQHTGTEVSGLPLPQRQHQVTDSTFVTQPQPPPPEHDHDQDEFILSDESHVLLESIAEYPLLPTAKRFDSLGFSRRKGQAIRTMLEDAGLVESHDIPTPEGKTVLLGLTDTGRRQVDETKIAAINGSLLHAYWQDRIAKDLETQGWFVQLEAVVDDRRVDVLAQRDGRCLIVEVETGKSDWQSKVEWLAGLKEIEIVVLCLDRILISRISSGLGIRAKVVTPSTWKRVAD